MGLNTRCLLPVTARLDDIATVTGLLLGLNGESVFFGHNRGSYVRVPGITYQTNNTNPEHLEIVIDLTQSTSPAAKAIQATDSVIYHLGFFFQGDHVGPAIYPASTPAKIALCVGLARFFGGIVDYNDCDEKDINLRVKAKENTHRSNEQWDAFQARLRQVEPITEEEIAKYERHAAHPTREVRSKRHATV